MKWLFGAAVTLLAFTIKALNDDWSLEPEICPGSHMRVYLVALLCGQCPFIGGLAIGCIETRKNQSTGTLASVFVCYGVACAIWGWVEAFHLACDVTKNSVSAGGRVS